VREQRKIFFAFVGIIFLLILQQEKTGQGSVQKKSYSRIL
jgi:hypothetical protein